jgi:hypothetical protein
MKGSWIILSTQKFEVASLCIEHRYTVSEIEQQWSSDKDFFCLLQAGECPLLEMH